MDSREIRKRFDAAYKLLTQQTTSKEKFEEITILISGVDQRIDRVLASCSKALDALDKLQQSAIIELVGENLPEQTEEDKKRKKAILFFIRTFKQLRSEVERVKAEFDKIEKKQESKIQGSSKILAFAKGPLGIITLAAVAIVAFYTITNLGKKGETPKTPTKTNETTKESVTKIKVIVFAGKQISFDEFQIFSGPDCDNGQSPHYHAKNHRSVAALDGSTILDPGACGFGRVKDTPVIEITPSR